MAAITITVQEKVMFKIHSMSKKSPHIAKMLANFALVAFQERQENAKEMVHPGVYFYRYGDQKGRGIIEADGDDICMIRKDELIDYARRCLRDSLSGAFQKLDIHEGQD